LTLSLRTVIFSVLTMVGVIGLVSLALLATFRPPTTFYGITTFLMMPMIFLALAVIGAYGLLTGMKSQRRVQEDKALEILRERFAKGELSEEEFLKMKKLLEEKK